MTLLRRARRSEAGAALVELAIALPFLVLVFAATIDFGRIFYASIALTNAARAGAQYGAHNAAQSGDTATMQTRATGASPNLTGVTAVATRLCECATDAGTIPFSATSPPNTCDSSTACSSTTHLVVTVTVTVSKTFTTIMSGVPGIPGSVSLSRTATMRVMQ